MTQALTDQKSLALKIKRAIGHKAWRMLTRPVAWALKLVPQRVLFAVGLMLRKGSYPYSIIQEGDVAVQVGAPHDLLRIGRSRAVYFAMLVGKTGRLFIFEPEPKSARAMEAYLARAGLSDRVTVVNKGCWYEERVLRFWANPDHPASNLLEDVSEWPVDELERRGYRPSEVPVIAMDTVLAEAGVARVKVLSVTTNGSEEEILRGAEGYLAGKVDYLALAETGPEVQALSAKHGFVNIATDDRGFTSKRQG